MNKFQIRPLADILNIQPFETASSKDKPTVESLKEETLQASLTNILNIKYFETTSSKDKPTEETLKEETREAFLAWLIPGQGIFHIGKAGSGKSTLMKFLGNSVQAQDQLRH